MSHGLSRRSTGYIHLFVKTCVPQNRTSLLIFMLLNGSSPSPRVKHTCDESFYPGSEIRPRSLRRVLYRVFRLRPHRLPHHDGGVGCSPSVSRGLIPLRLYSLLSQVGSSCAFGSQKLPGAPSVASSKRQPETATVWIQHHVNTA